MKIRNGFVSNSSTSSFMLVTSEKSHIIAWSQLSEGEQKVVGQIMYPKTFCGKPVWSGATYSGMSGEGTWEWIAPVEGIDSYDTWSKYKQLLISDETITEDIDA